MLGSDSSRRRSLWLLFPYDLAQKAEQFIPRRDWDR